MRLIKNKNNNNDNKNDKTINKDEARQLFEFNTNYLSFSEYNDQTVVKNPKFLVANHLKSGENILISENFLLNYKMDNDYIGFKNSVSEFFTDIAINTFVNSDFFEDDIDVIKLPLQKKINAPFSNCIISRRSCRKFENKSLSLQDLSNILYYATGVSCQTSVKDGFSKKVKLRNNPSGGGLYPINLYFHAHNIEKLDDGFYLYQPYSHTIKKVNTSKNNYTIRDFAEYSFINAEDSNIIFIYVYDLIKNSRKYGSQATVYALIEAGEIAQNIQLTSTALTYGCLDIGGYNKVFLENLLNLDGTLNHVIHMTIVGNKGSNE